MRAHDIGEVMKTAPHWTGDDDESQFWVLEGFNQGHLWVGRFKGIGPWTRHPGGDALLHQLSGRTDVTLLEKGGPAIVTLSPGQVCLVPTGRWYRVSCGEWAAQYGVTSSSTEHAPAGESPQGG